MSTNPPSLALQHLYMVRAQVDLAIATLEGATAAVDGCPHPDEKRLDTSVAGQPATFLCQVCGQEVEGIA